MPTTRTSTRPRSLIAAAVLLAAGLAALIAAPSASALGFAAPPSGLSAAPTDLQAGANSDFNIHVGFTDPADDVENLTISLPPGLVGNPNAAPQCTVAELEGAGCPAESQVGTVATGLSISGIPQTVNGGLFNLTPQPGEPARFGIRLSALPLTLPVLGDVLLPPIIMQSAVKLRSDDYGLDTIINGIPNTATLLQAPPLPEIEVPIDITAMDVGLLGQVGQGAFLRNPTTCAPATVRFTADSHTGSTSAPDSVVGQANPFTPTGCDQLDFSPEFTAKIGAPGMTGQGTRPPVTTVISQGATEAGLRRAEVLLPTVLGSNPDPLSSACAEADFQDHKCTGGSVVGSAVASSPLLTEPLTGPVVLVANESGLPKVGLDLRGQLELMLKGEFVFGASTGVAFDGLPDIPISVFQLRFNENNLVVADVDLCTTPAVFSTSFESHTGATAGGPATAAIEGCGAAGPAKGGAGKCKKAKKKRKQAGKSEAVAAKKKKKKSRKRCKKKRRKRK